MTPDQRSEVGIDLTLGYDDAPRERSDAPFCLLVLGDFGGEAARGPLAERRALAFDRDDLDDVIGRVGPVIRPAAAGGSIRFQSLDDFHPDRLFAALPLFEQLRELRGRLQDGRTFAAAARELTGETAAPAPPGPSPQRPGGSLLEQMVAETGGAEGMTSYATSGATGTAADDLAGFIRSIVRKHLVADPDPRQAQLVSSVDAAVAAQLRAVLHDPVFRALESAWRTLDRLARRVETSTSLRLTCSTFRPPSWRARSTTSRTAPRLDWHAPWRGRQPGCRTAGGGARWWCCAASARKNSSMRAWRGWG